MYKEIRLIKKIKPNLVFVNLPGIFESLHLSQFLSKYNYINLCQLVTQFEWEKLTVDVHNKLTAIFTNAKVNYVVSINNGEILKNYLLNSSFSYKLIGNPFKFSDKETIFKNTLSFAYVGRYDIHHKGLDMLLSAAHKLSQNNIEYTLNLYGAGGQEFIVQKFINFYQLKTTFINKHTHVEKIWEDNDVLLLTSRQEGQSLALLEAMALGKIVVTTNVGGANEIIQNGVNGFIANSVSTEDIYDTIVCAIKKKNEWPIIGNNAIQTIRQTYINEPHITLANDIIKIVN